MHFLSLVHFLKNQGNPFGTPPVSQELLLFPTAISQSFSPIHFPTLKKKIQLIKTGRPHTLGVFMRKIFYDYSPGVLGNKSHETKGTIKSIQTFLYVHYFLN